MCTRTTQNCKRRFSSSTSREGAWGYRSRFTENKKAFSQFTKTDIILTFYASRKINKNVLEIHSSRSLRQIQCTPDEQVTIPFAANPCGFCRESFAVIAWRTTNDCFCCESLRLLSWVFCGDRLTNKQRLLLLRILAASVVSLLRWSPYEQPTIAFAANSWGFCRESIAVIALRTSNHCFCCEFLGLLSWVYCGDRLPNK